MIVLMFLVTAQIVFIVSRTKIKKSGIKVSNKTKTGEAENQQISDIIGKIKKVSSAIEKNEKEPSKEKESINPNLFSKFQQNLDQSEKTGNDENQPQKPEEVVLSISGKKPVAGKEVTGDVKNPIPSRTGKKNTIPASYSPYKQSSNRKKPHQQKDVEKPQIGDIDVDPIDSLFDDIDESSTIKPLVTPISPQPRKHLASLEKSELKESKKTTPLEAHEILTSEDLSSSLPQNQNEIDLLLSLVRKSFKEEDYQEVITAINQWLRNNTGKENPHEKVKELLMLKGNSEFSLKQYEEAVKTWQIYLKNYLKSGDSNSLKQIEEWNKNLIDAGQYKYGLHFLFTALNEHRQNKNYSRMDYTYTHIETAYEQLQDWPRKIQTLQNHLAIKKALKDFRGQLTILDHLGKLLYDQGDAVGSKKCYEQTIVIKKQMGRG